MMRMITALDSLRSWDISGNDLNQNSQLDAGDVLRVLRAVVGLDPQPGPLQPLARQAASAGLALTADKLRVSVGDKVKVRVRTAGQAKALAGAGFSISFPSEALWLENSSSIRVGSIVPANTLNLWNLEPLQNHFDLQNGMLHFAVSGNSPWAEQNGDLLEVTFTVRPGAFALKTLPITLGNASLTDGWEVEPAAGATIELASFLPVPAELSRAIFADGTLRLEARGNAGLRYAVETSTDLQVWEQAAEAIAGPDGLITVRDASGADAAHLFYRLRQAD
jgi:hypothetical protein